MRFLLLLAFLSPTVFGVSLNDLKIVQFNGSVYVDRLVDFNTDGTTNSIWVQANDASNPRPKRGDLPSYIVYDATGQTITIQNLPQTAVSGLVAALANIPGAPSVSYTTSRAIGNTGWQISASRNSEVNYSVSIATALSLTGGAAGYVSLETAADSGFTTSLQEIGRVTNSQTGTLTIGLALNQTISGALSGFVPAGNYVRLKSVNTTGTPTYAFIVGQETLH